jgi:iron complex outermembrane receptor protein
MFPGGLLMSHEFTGVQPRNAVTTVLLVLLLTLRVQAAHAAGDSDALAEVTVTAQKKTQDIQDVPISIQALKQDDLRGMGITSTEGLGNATPGLMVNDYGNPVITIFTLRGVQQFDFGDHQESPIALFTDGVYVPFLSAVGLDFFDMDHVEVLRGPQGTLFGRNATGGAIQLQSAAPTQDFTAYVQADAGNYAEHRVEAAVSGPIGAGWLGRLSVLKDEHSGYYNNLIGRDPGDADGLGWRAQLAHDLGDQGRFSLIVRGSHDDTTSSPGQAAPAYPDATTGLLLPGAANPAAYAQFCLNYFGASTPAHPVDCLSGDSATGNPFNIHANRVGHFLRTTVGASANLDWDFGFARLTSITAYGHLSKNYGGEDSDGTSLDLLTFAQTVDAKNASEELRLAGKSGPHDWIAGVYGLYIDGHYGTEQGYFMFDPTLNADTGNAYSLRTRTWAVFAQDEITLAPRWSLTAGLRWTGDDKNFTMTTPCVGPGCDVLGLTSPDLVQGTGYTDSVPGARTSRVSGNWDGKLQLSYKPIDGVLTYAGVSRGTKAGGFNGGAAAFYTVNQAIFDDEVLTDYEIGAKTDLAGGRVRANVSSFYYRYENMQVFNQIGPSTVTFNRDARIYGAEADLQALLAPGLESSLGVSLLHTRIDPVQNVNILTGESTSSPEELPNSPHVTVNARLAKSWLIGPSGKLVLEGDGKWVGGHKLSLIDNPATHESAFYTLDGRLSYGASDGSWEVALYSQNLTDQQYRIVATPFASFDGSLIEVFGPPRTFGGSIRVRF